MHSFGAKHHQHDEESTDSSSSSESSTLSDVDESGYDFGFGKSRSKSHGNKDHFTAKLMCAAKLGFLAAILMMLLGYLSVTLFGMKWFQTEDPVSRAKLMDWQKLSLYSGVVFLIVTLGSVMIASAK